MLRFAVAVTVLELVLTAGAAWWVTLAESTGAHVTERDLGELGLPFTSVTPSSTRAGDTANHETRAALLDPGQTLYTSLRTGSTAVDFDHRKRREEAWARKSGGGAAHSIADEPLPGEEGYSVRQSGPKSLRFELVRLRGSDLLIVRITMDAPGHGEMAKAERRARKVQERLMGRLGWGLDR
jgi:hypothetical protein